MPSLVTPLPHLAVLRVAGPDARRFLQGQLSNDIERLETVPGLRAGLHTPQGRVIALLQLFPAGEDVLMVLPRDLATAVATQLRRVILRAKVRVEDESARHTVFGISEDGVRRLRILPSETPAPTGEPGTPDAWQAADIADGLPQVVSATSGQFVAQMLNLDRVDGISFRKGCYTGQEIIARAHYRGRVKRRLQRFATTGARTLSPGDRIALAEGRVADVIQAVALPAGRQEFLAVAPLPGEAPGAIGGEETEGADLPRLVTEALPLPYALEDDAPA